MRSMFQKPHIIFTEQPQIIDPVFQHGRSFNAHTKCKAGIFITVDTTIVQHSRMHHTATENFHPTGFFTNITTFAATDQATDIHFGTWFGKRKISWAKTDLYSITKHFLYKKVQGLFKISERNIFSNV